ncbi:MAG: D-tyrosyl-tRNA(Tyr) deacylase [Clostridia bacterium]|nr:D-tyrosyl-tRNA(Tyr) deacylase [Clostridia bacterium]
MIAVIQRVKCASVVSDGVPTGSIEAGLMLLLGVKKGDRENDALLLAEKISKLRIFSDENGKMNRSVKDIGGGALIVSNFTLCANYAHGNRPDYMEAEKPPRATELYEHFVSLMRERVASVGTGVFGADMEITMKADGPVTIVMDSEILKNKGK